MPAHRNPRCEAFARAVVAGVGIENAYEDAGFTPGYRHAARLARRQDVVERMAELRAEVEGLAEASGPAVVAGLMRILKAGEELTSPAAMKEARLTLLEAWKVALETARERNMDRASSGLSVMLMNEAVARMREGDEAYARQAGKPEASPA